MQLASIRLITAEIGPLVRFYEAVTGARATVRTPDFAEVFTTAGTLAIGSTRTLALFGGQHVARAAANHSAIIEFRVDDVDAAFARLATILGEAVVQPPTTMPWGNRSLLFRDPDGNLVNFFTPTTAQATARTSRQTA
jgi:catechol 2,3-dioxygenase-like lactoylglutathione lyase family enzyme